MDYEKTFTDLIPMYPVPLMKETADTPARADIELETRLKKELLAAFGELCNQLQRGAESVFDYFLKFTINAWEACGKGLGPEALSQEQNALVLEFYKKYVAALRQMLATRPWYDFLGFLYENTVASQGHKKANEQFFTPANICDLMAALTSHVSEGEPEGSAPVLYDPCCGSGRTLLSGWSKNRNSRVEAGDIDLTCAMMTVVNCLLHGVTARVTHGDSLTGDVWSQWEVNFAKYAFGIVPHCVRSK